MTGPNNKLLRWTILLFAVFFVAEVVLSYLALLILKSGVIDNTFGMTFVALLIGFVIYIFVTVLVLNSCCFDLADKTMYFKAA